MKVTFRLSTESSFSVTIPDNSTVDNLRHAAQIGCPASAKLPADFKLIYNGAKLHPHYRALASFGVEPSTETLTVIVMSEGTDTPVSSPRLRPVADAPRRKPKKNRCTFSNCNAAPLRMVGDCGQCHGKFCAKHRLLEDHMCTGLQVCKDSAHERNAMKLQQERTIASRV